MGAGRSGSKSTRAGRTTAAAPKAFTVPRSTPEQAGFR